MIGRVGSFLRDAIGPAQVLKVARWLVDFVFGDQDRLKQVGEDPGIAGMWTLRGRLAKILSLIGQMNTVQRVKYILAGRPDFKSFSSSQE